MATPVKLTGEYRTSNLRPVSMPSVQCPMYGGEWKVLSFCLACDYCEAGRWKRDMIEVWCKNFGEAK